MLAHGLDHGWCMPPALAEPVVRTDCVCPMMMASAIIQPAVHRVVAAQLVRATVWRWQS